MPHPEKADYNYLNDVNRKKSEQALAPQTYSGVFKKQVKINYADK